MLSIVYKVWFYHSSVYYWKKINCCNGASLQVYMQIKNFVYKNQKSWTPFWRLKCKTFCDFVTARGHPYCSTNPSCLTSQLSKCSPVPCRRLVLSSCPGNTRVHETTHVLNEKVTRKVEQYEDPATGKLGFQTVEYVEKLVEHKVGGVWEGAVGGTLCRGHVRGDNGWKTMYIRGCGRVDAEDS